MAGPDVAAIAADLARAVELTMSAGASQGDRLKAYTACESFKETSPLCAEAGLFLAAGTRYSLVVRHFGLQLMEHTVKYRWNQISQQEKIFIKVCRGLTIHIVNVYSVFIIDSFVYYSLSLIGLLKEYDLYDTGAYSYI